MRIINPKLISGEIMNLIDEANEKMVFVSPYYHITKWTKLLHCLENMKKRKVSAEFYIREDAIECVAEVRAAGFSPLPIKRLHTKLYFNEKQAIISSMNLDVRSDNQSLDIALITEDEKEYEDVIVHFEKFIRREVVRSSTSTVTVGPRVYGSWKAELDLRLEESLQRNVYIKSFSKHIEIQAGNLYEASIATEFGSVLMLSGILSREEYRYAKENNVFKGGRMAIYLQEGGQRGNSYVYDMVCGRMSHLKSRSVHSIQPEEQELIIDTIHKFILGVEEFKKMKRGVSFPPGV